MSKFWKNTINTILVLTLVSFFSATIIILANLAFPPKDSFLDKNKLFSVCPADDYYELIDDDFSSIGIELSSFDSKYSNIRSVFMAIGGENDGNYIIEALGYGFQDKYPIILYVAYNSEGEIMGVIDLNVDARNSYWGVVKPHLDEIFDNLIGKKGDIGGGGDLLEAYTGATQSLNGIARAVNIANQLISYLLDANSSEPFEVEDEVLLANLRKITEENENFICYPYATIETINSFPARVLAVYLSENGYMVFETKADAGAFGAPTLLVSVNYESNTVIAVNPISMNLCNDPSNGIETEFLFDSDVLTAMFFGKSIETINEMDQYLTGATGATQSSNGIKTAIIVALENIDSFSEFLLDGGEIDV